jgi:hypothetical protein
MKKIIIYSLHIFLTFIFTCQGVSPAFADEKNSGLSLQDIALPTESRDMIKNSGAVFYTPSKNKILVPVHLWGHLNRPGLHYIPSETTFIKAISSSGGPLPNAKLEDISLSRSVNGKVEKYNFDLSDGGNEKAQTFVVQPGDVIFVKQDRFFENRLYYTSLVSIAVTLLTGVFIYRQIQHTR